MYSWSAKNPLYLQRGGKQKSELGSRGKEFRKRVLNGFKKTRLSQGHVAPPPPQSRLVTHRKTEKEIQLADRRGREGGGGAKSYDSKKAWSST